MTTFHPELARDVRTLMSANTDFYANGGASLSQYEWDMQVGVKEGAFLLKWSRALAASAGDATPAVPTSDGVKMTREAINHAARYAIESDLLAPEDWEAAGVYDFAHALTGGIGVVDDLRTLVARLAQSLRKAAPGNELAEKAVDYLRRHGLQGSPLRDGAPAAPQVAAAPAGHKLVPMEITEEMHAAAVRTIVRCTGNSDFPPRVWRAMLAAAPEVAAPAEQYTHWKAGGTYTKIGEGSMQSDIPLPDMSRVVIYQGDDGKLWVRCFHEFRGRFNLIETDADRAAQAECTGKAP